MRARKQLVEELDAVYSVFIRLKYADHAGYVSCYTCIARAMWFEVQCGHFIRRGNEAVRWDEDNTRPQCRDCNEFHNGREEAFEEELREEIGDDAVESLFERARGSYLPDDEVAALLVHYRAIVKVAPKPI